MTASANSVRMVFTGSKKTLEEKILKLDPCRRGSHAQDSIENFPVRGCPRVKREQLDTKDLKEGKSCLVYQGTNLGSNNKSLLKVIV